MVLQGNVTNVTLSNNAILVADATYAKPHWEFLSQPPPKKKKKDKKRKTCCPRLCSLSASYLPFFFFFLIQKFSYSYTQTVLTYNTRNQRHRSRSPSPSTAKFCVFALRLDCLCRILETISSTRFLPNYFARIWLFSLPRWESRESVIQTRKRQSLTVM